MRKPPNTPEFARFTAALRDVLKVSPEEMQEKQAALKESGKRLSKGASSLDPAVSATIRAAFEV
jgi:hypothetical protein